MLVTSDSCVLVIVGHKCTHTIWRGEAGTYLTHDSPSRLTMNSPGSSQVFDFFFWPLMFCTGQPSKTRPPHWKERRNERETARVFAYFADLKRIFAVQSHLICLGMRPLTSNSLVSSTHQPFRQPSHTGGRTCSSVLVFAFQPGPAHVPRRDRHTLPVLYRLGLNRT